MSNEFVDTTATARSESAVQTVKELAALFAQDAATYGELKVMPFKESYKISTYLYCICVGPYLYQEDNAEGLPPMKIYARKSLIGECNFQEMFKVTQAGIRFYSKFFGQEYPFNKYD